MKSLIAIAIIAAALNACGSRFTPTPTDAEMIASFKAHRAEFDFWKDIFGTEGNNCWIVRHGNTLAIDSTHPGDDPECEKLDRARMLEFMRDAGIYKMGTGAKPEVHFICVDQGGVVASQMKEILYSLDDKRPLVDDLDSLDLSRRRDAGQELEQGTWYRRIEENWYLEYYVDL